MEPVSLTLAGVGALALSEGVKFLYSAAGDLLKRWLDHKQKPDAEPQLQVEVRLPEAFSGQLHPATVDADALTRNEAALTDACQRLSLYAAGVKPIEPSDPELLKKTDELRAVLERILNQTITLKGEGRPPSGSPVVRGTVTAQTVSGELGGVHGENVLSGLVEAKVDVGSVQSGAEVYGVKVKNIGS
jgi:hypothetical protein